MNDQSVYTFVNQQNGNLSFKIFEFDNNSYFDHIQRNNYFTLVLITDGAGIASVDFQDYTFDKEVLFAFYPYQPFMLQSRGSLKGYAIQFHHDFFCIYNHHKEIATNGILFNNAYQLPFIRLTGESEGSLLHIINQIISELSMDGVRKDEVIVSYLKIFLVVATRLKLSQQQIDDSQNENRKQWQIVQDLRNAIEEHYKSKHSASDYAALLHMTPVVLSRIAKTHFNKTLSHLITERIIIEAKRELYLTGKTIKEIAYELGYDDEFYFSRMFKEKTDISPQLYRNTVGFNRGVIQQPI